MESNGRVYCKSGQFIFTGIEPLGNGLPGILVIALDSGDTIHQVKIDYPEEVLERGYSSVSITVFPERRKGGFAFKGMVQIIGATRESGMGHCLKSFKIYAPKIPDCQFL